jgi:hypothetical protein
MQNPTPENERELIEIFAQIAKELGVSHEELFTEATELGFAKPV